MRTFVPPLLRAFKASFFVIILLSMFQSEANATHFRGGTLTWQQAGGNKITFTLNTQWRRGFFPGQTVGSTNNIGSITFGDGTSQGITATVNAVDIANDVSFMTWTFTKTYTTPGNYVVNALNSGDRIAGLLDGNNNSRYNLQTIVNVGSLNNPPVTSLPAIVNLPIGATNATFTIPGSDPDNNPLTYRLSRTGIPAAGESGLVTAAPAGLTLSPSGVVTMNTTSRLVNQQFSVQVMIEDGLTKTPVDFIIRMVAFSNPPVFVAPSPAQNAVINVTPPGNNVNFTIAATDPDAGQTTTLNPVALPLGASMSPVLPASSAPGGSVQSTFNWTPTVGQVGSYVVNFVAIDNVGIQSFRTVRINVLCPLAIVVDNATPPSCTGLSNGAISVSVQNGSAPANLRYAWTGPGTFTSNLEDITGLAAGNYSLRVDDVATGCFTSITRELVPVNSAPVITCPANISVNNTPGQCGANVSFSVPATGTPAPVITYSKAPGSLFGIGTTTVTVTATNSCGTTSCSFDVTVADREAPTITCAAPVTINNTPGLCTGSTTLAAPVVNDNCGNAINFNLGADGVTSNATANIPIGNSARTFSAWVNPTVSNNMWGVMHQGNFDCNRLMFGLGLQSGNKVTFWGGCWDYVSTLEVPLNQWTYIAVTYNGANNYVLYMNGTAVPFTLFGALNTQASRFFVGHETTTNGADFRNQFQGSIDEVKVYNRVLTAAEIAADRAGSNPAGSNLVLYYPFNEGAGTVINDVAGNNTATLVNPTGSNWVTGPSLGLTVTNDAPVVYPVGTTPVIWTATDAAGNSSTCTQMVTVTDNELPVIATNGDKSVNNDANVCGAAVEVNASATDNCTVGAPTGVRSDGEPLNANYPVGVTTITWDVSDINGNPAVPVLQTITVTDVTKPVPDVTTLPTITGECAAAVTPPTATDNCAGLIIGTTTDATSFTAQGTYVINWSYDDGNGNVETQQQTVIVKDITKPKPDVTNLPDITGECAASATAPTATDNCSGIITGTTTDPTSFSSQGSYIINWTYDDGNGNVETQQQTVIVKDITKPKPDVTTLPDVTGECAASATAPTATDNCSGLITGTTTDPTSFTAQGTYVINWTYDDGNGNVETQQQTVIVKDVTNPVAKCKPVTVTLAGGTASISVADINDGSYDNCGIQSITASPLNFNCSNIGNNNVTLTVTDIAGNVSTCTAVVTVVGEIPTCSIASIPSSNVFTGGVSTNLYLGYGAQSTTLQVSAPASGAPYTYAWSGGTLSNYNTANPVFTATTAGTFTFTVEVTNKYGCKTTCSITICVTDIRVPGTNGNKVYVCHIPPGNPANPQTLSISVNAVPAHVGLHGGDRLGTCDMLPCTAPSIVTKKSAVDAAEAHGKLTVTVAPNPTSTYFTFRLHSEDETPVTIRIVNGTGQVLESVNKVNSNGTVQMGSRLVNGMYFAEFMQGTDRQVIKVMKIGSR